MVEITLKDGIILAMTTLLLALLVVIGLGSLGLGVYSHVKATRFVNSTLETIYYAFENKGQDGFTPVIRFIDQTTEVAAQKIGVSVQAAIKGSLGGSMKGINAELEQVAADNDPGAAAMMALPKSLRKNPIAMMGLQYLTQNLINGGKKQPSNGATNPGQARFTL